MHCIRDLDKIFVKNMETNVSEDIEKDVKTEPTKPKLIDKLKEIRWTFKIKNNFTKYVTVEPLVCFYMLHIFMVSLIEPYHFRKVFSLIKYVNMIHEDAMSNMFTGLRQSSSRRLFL